MCRTVALAAVAAAGWCTPLCAGASASGIVLLGVPDRLAFPMDKGRNALLTVRTPDAGVRQVWLAPSREFPGRVMLRRVDERTYQINLAEEIVYRVLQANRGASTFRVFAEDRAGKRYASIAISYRLATADRARKLDIRVWTECRDADQASRDRSWRYAPRWRSGRLGRVWVSPGHTSRVGFYCDVSYRAYFQAGKRKWPMTPSGERQAYFVFDKEAEAAVRKTRSARVVYVLDDGGASRAVELRVAPTRIDLPRLVAKLTLAEYRSETVPGSDGYLKLSVGRIGGHRALVKLEGADGRGVVRQTAMSQGMKTTFEFGVQTYVLDMKQLSQSVFGEDFVVIYIYVSPPATQPKAGAGT